jgi:hypothetical protein
MVATRPKESVFTLAGLWQGLGSEGLQSVLVALVRSLLA